MAGLLDFIQTLMQGNLDPGAIDQLASNAAMQGDPAPVGLALDQIAGSMLPPGMQPGGAQTFPMQPMANPQMSPLASSLRPEEVGAMVGGMPMMPVAGGQLPGLASAGMQQPDVNAEQEREKQLMMMAFNAMRQGQGQGQQRQAPAAGVRVAGAASPAQPIGAAPMQNMQLPGMLPGLSSALRRGR